MKKLAILFILSSLLVLPLHTNAAVKKLGQTGFKFLDVGVGARATGMGEAYMMVGNDANALFYNPAGITSVESKFELLTNRTSWFAGVNYMAGGLVANMGTLGHFGLTYVAADYGDDIYGTRYDETVEAGYIETGKVETGAYALGLAYARRLTNKFTVGGRIQYASVHLGSNIMAGGNEVENKASSLIYNFGTIFHPGFKSLSFGMSVNSFSPDIEFEREAFEAPLTFKVGFGFDFMDLIAPDSGNSLLFDIEGIHPRDYTQRVHVGTEYMFQGMFALRGGYKFNYDEAGLTGGVGVNVDLGGLGIKADFSYSEFGIFDSVNRFSFSIVF